MGGMRRPIFVRSLSDAEREALEDGLRSKDAFVLRRCQILLASSRGENAYRIARSLGCDSQTARAAIKRLNEGASKRLCTGYPQGPRRFGPPSTRGEPSGCVRCFTGAPGSLERTRARGHSPWPPR